MLRKGTIHDCNEIYQLICEMESTQLPFDEFRLIYQEQLMDEHYYCLVYEKDGAVAAVLNMRFERQLHHASFIAEIMEFAVSSSDRGNGIGGLMFENACQIAKERHCVQIEAASSQYRGDAHRFYVREGMHNSHFKFCKKLP